MATDIERLVVSLEANIKKYDTAMQKALGQTNSTMAKIEKRTAESSNLAAANFGKLGAVFAGFASVKGAQALIDTAIRIDNALKVAGLSGDQLTQVYDTLFVSAQKNAAPLESLVQLYGRVSMVQKELGASTQDMLKFTDNVAVALRVSGRSATESSGALLQLSQALGSGVVRSQEFNSMLEGALPIVQAAARGIEEVGGSVSKLRTLVNEGKVSSEAFFKGFQAGAVTLNQQVAGSSLTVAQGFTRLENVAVDAAKRINDAAGISKSATSALDALAFVVTKLGDAFAHLAKAASESNATEQVDNIVAAARNLWNDPSFKNLYAFLFDASGSRAAAAVNDAISNRVAGIEALRKAMQDANAETVKGQAKKSDQPNRFDDAFSQFATKKVKLSDFPVKDDKGTAGERDAFERRMAMTQRQIDLMSVEAKTIDQTIEARERARIIVELETAARRANEDAGKKNTAVTDEQREKIEALADAYAKAKGQLEQLNGPLASFARESSNVGRQLEGMAANSLDRIASDFGDIVAGTKTVEDAFKSMAQSIISELAKIAIKKAVLGPLAGAIGALFGGGTAGAPLDLMSFMGKASGGYISGPGTGRSDSIPARLSNGEFVVNAAATRQNRALLEAINSSRVRAFAGGGYVGPIRSAARAGYSGSSPNIVVKISNNPIFQAGMTPTDMAAIRVMLAQNSRQTQVETIQAIRKGQRATSTFLTP